MNSYALMFSGLKHYREVKKKMITKVKEKHYLTCGCCGKYYHGIIPKENGVQIYDNGIGMCLDCGGNPKAKSVKKQMGWAACTFYEARFKILRDALGEKVIY